MAATKQHQMMKFTLHSRHVLTADETELYELTFLAGITMDPQVFKIVVDLLKMNVAPMAIMQMLKSLRNRRRKGPPSVHSTSSNDSGNSKPHSARSDPSSLHVQAPAASRSRPTSTRPDRPPSRSRPGKSEPSS